ncbi:MAG TPA: tetratricopeptide repeat protein [Candidatus Limnocylindrales bacterium]|nr:tetratricopeptide repeat protein [Candidatus Limnocylindrales bacterium]
MKFNQLLLIGLLIFLLAVSLSIKYQSVVTYLFGDEAVYYIMAQSLAFDRDLEYTQGDLIRFYKDWHGGPQGVFLTRVVQNGEEKIYYGKPFIYPLFLAPFVYLFGLRGFLIFNTLLLVSMITLGYLYLKKYNSEQLALLFSLTFFLVTAGFIYTFWSTPEIFQMFLITSGLFVLFYETPLANYGQAFGKTPGRKYLSALLIGLATFSKPHNGIFILPLLTSVILPRSEIYLTSKKGFVARIHYFWQRYKYVLSVGLVFLLILGILSGIQFLFMSQWNAYAGDRKTFYWHFPLESAGAGFDNLGTKQTHDVYFEESFYFNPKVFLYNLFYYLFGRFTGIFPYYFPALVALFCFLLNPRSSLRFVLLGTIVIHILIYILWAPSNYHGGSGAIGNRFFLNIYPAFLFLTTQIPGGFGTILITWLVGFLFLAQILINPFYSSNNPAQHAFRFPYRILPVELTEINSLPINTNRHMIQNFSGDSPSYDLYLLNDNYMGRSSKNFWVRGEAKLEAVLKVNEKQDDLLVILENGPFQNTVDLEVAGVRRTFHLEGDERKEIIFPLKTAFPFFKAYLYPINITSYSGFIPRFAYANPTERLPYLFSLDKVKDDTRYLGCLVQISLNPGKIGLAYQKNGNTDKALFYLEQAVEQEPENLALYIALSEAYQQVGRFTRSRIVLEKAKKLIPTYVANFNRSIGKSGGEEVDGAALTSDSSLKFLQSLLIQSFEAENLRRTTGGVVLDSEASGGRAVSSRPDTPISGESINSAILTTSDVPNSQSDIQSFEILKTSTISTGKGFLTYGPFQDFPAGAYQVRYRLKIKDHLPPSEAVPATPLLAMLDVRSGRYGILGRRSLLREDFTASDTYQNFSLSFVNPETSSLEFRVETSGIGTLLVDKIDVYPLLPFQIPYLMGVSYAKEGNWEQALTQLSPLFALDPTYPHLSYYMILGWVKLKEWEEALKVLQHEVGREILSLQDSGRVGEDFESTLSLSSLYEEVKHEPIPQEVPLYKYFIQIRELLQPQIPVQINFDNQLAFIGYDLPKNQFRPSETFPITYYWKALAKMDKNYAIFVHFSKKKFISSDLIRKVKQKLGISLVDFFQQDHFPLQNLHPTDTWLPGEVVKERYQVQIPPYLVPGTYEIWIGVWDPKNTGRRLKAGGQEKMKIGEIEIQK